MIDFTLVVGIDAEHLKQLEMVWPTWKKHKPGLMNVPMIVFYDSASLTLDDMPNIFLDNNISVQFVKWINQSKRLGNHDKWNDPHRKHMLSGFVFVPPQFVRTRYWLKLDTDVVAIGQPDWIDEKWFESNQGYDPAIIAHRWSFTKPPDQMEKMDEWAAQFQGQWESPPLGLHPLPGGTRIGHKRIISWCGFFNTQFSKCCAKLTSSLPIGSQDGFHWYCAKRWDREIKRVDMKRLGFEHWNTARNIREAVARAMA